MKHEELIKRLEVSCLGLDAVDPLRLLVDDVVAALRQTEHEPVAYLCENAVGHRYFRWKKPSSTYKPIPLYTSPSQRKPLTDEEIADLYFDKFSMGELKAFAKAIERAHGIKGEA